MKGIKRLFPLALALSLLLTGCGQTGSAPSAPQEDVQEDVYVEQVPLEGGLLEDEAAALPGLPATVSELLPVASGTAVETQGDASIDYSNITDGYVMARYGADSEKKLKVQVTGPSDTTYTYDLPALEWTTFPLSDGSGGYKVTLLRNTQDKKYTTLASVSFSVTLEDEFGPFIRPNQYVDYSSAVNTVKKAGELTGGIDDPLEKVEKIYDFVVKTLKYDAQKASSVESGYLPVLDDVLAAKKGICFDYAALMAGMLRSQGVPCKLVVGYAGTAYHAWISVWTEETGWVDGVIFFDGAQWQRMDPTFASSGKGSEAIMKYIGDGSHYTAKYLY